MIKLKSRIYEATGKVRVESILDLNKHVRKILILQTHQHHNSVCRSNFHR